MARRRGATVNFALGHKHEAEALVFKYHYSHRAPGNVILVGTWHEDGGLFGDLGECIAACFFSIPPTRWSLPVAELSRLVRADHVAAQLTGLIAATVDAMRQTQWDLLVSYADATHGHHGGIYQAASWFYNGQQNPQMDGLIVAGAFVPGRTCNAKWNTQSPRKLSAILGRPIEAHFDEGKHLYWKPLNQKGKRKAVALGLQKRPYYKQADAGEPR